MTSKANRSNPKPGDPCRPLAKSGHASAVANSLAANAGRNQVEQTYVPATMAVRRLTPGECETLQGFPQGWTAITRKGKEAADGPRYRSLENSMAVPVISWLGRRILSVGDRPDTPALQTNVLVADAKENS